MPWTWSTKPNRHSQAYETFLFFGCFAQTARQLTRLRPQHGFEPPTQTHNCGQPTIYRSRVFVCVCVCTLRDACMFVLWSLIEFVLFSKKVPYEKGWIRSWWFRVLVVRKFFLCDSVKNSINHLQKRNIISVLKNGYYCWCLVKQIDFLLKDCEQFLYGLLRKFKLRKLWFFFIIENHIK